MRYVEFRESIQAELHRSPEGLTWAELRERLDLPYDRPCPAWTASLEREVGLVRTRSGRAHVWTLRVHQAVASELPPKVNRVELEAELHNARTEAWHDGDISAWPYEV